MLGNVISCVSERIQQTKLIFKNLVMKKSKEQKILGVTKGNKLNCKSQIKELCKKPSQKIGALSRLSNYLNDSEKKLVFNSQ